MKLFVGRNFRHFEKNSSLSPDKVSPDKVSSSKVNVCTLCDGVNKVEGGTFCEDHVFCFWCLPQELVLHALLATYVLISYLILPIGDIRPYTVY